MFTLIQHHHLFYSIISMMIYDLLKIKLIRTFLQKQFVNFSFFFNNFFFKKKRNNKNLQYHP